MSRNIRSWIVSWCPFRSNVLHFSNKILKTDSKYLLYLNMLPLDRLCSAILSLLRSIYSSLHVNAAADSSADNAFKIIQCFALYMVMNQTVKNYMFLWYMRYFTRTWWNATDCRMRLMSYILYLTRPWCVSLPVFLLLQSISDFFILPIIHT